MKYCLFESGDVVGPFLVEELLAKKGFDAHSLVCPEEHSEEETFWKEAHLYDDFKLQTPEPVAAESPVEEEAFPSEMRHSVEQWNSVEDKTDKKVADEELHTEPAISLAQAEKETLPDSAEKEADKMQISSLLMRARKYEEPDTSENEKTPTTREEVVAQLISTRPNPIEEYFNSMRSGDLGNILGIPDPKANSDMNLARMLEKQFEKTDPQTLAKSANKEENPMDSFAQALITNTAPLPANESTEAATPEEKDALTQSQLQATAPAEKPELDLTPEFPVNFEDKTAAQEETGTASFPPALVVPLQEDDPTDQTVSTILEGSLEIEKEPQELAEPIKQIETTNEFNNSSALEQGRVVLPTEEPTTSPLKGLWLLITAICVLSAGAWIAWNEQEKTTTTSTTVAKASSAPAVTQPAAAPVALAAEPTINESQTTVNTIAVPEVIKTPEEQAQEIVQNYVLDNQRGTIANYLNRRYAQQLASGYAAVWSAEPLHRNVYIVNYRLSKTRQEPIIYIFQVDTAKKKLTGALNNITLDLVGQIK